MANKTILIPLTGTIINTVAIDGYRQGVEITEFKHWDAGTVKIRSGEKGHVMAPLNHAYDRLNDSIFNARYFDDKTVNLSLNVINNTEAREHTLIENSDGVGSAFGGIIEPITRNRGNKRPIINGKFLVDRTGVWGETVSFVSIFQDEDQFYQRPFADDYKSHQQNAVTISENIIPYIEKVITSSTQHSSMINAINNLPPLTENYVKSNEKIAHCGIDFENNSIVVDTLAFGGLTY